MSPDEYLRRVKHLNMDHEDHHLIHHFAKQMEKGEKFDPLAIYPDNHPNGRHRAHAAKKLGVKSIPVVVWPKHKANGGPVTPRALADAWTPPEDTDPRLGKFIEEYPSKMADAVVDTLKYPGQVYRGEKSVTARDAETGEERVSDEAIQKALDISNAAMTGGFGAAAIKPPVAGEYSNTLRMFAGPGSKTANLEALASAKEMIKNKVPVEEVRQATGWELTPHGDWRYEIADNKARLSPEAEHQMSATYRGEGPSSPLANKDVTYRLGETDEEIRHFLEHPEIFNAYPEMPYNILKGRWTPDRPLSGSYGPQVGFRVGAGYPDDALSAALHEVQHYIQRQEDWPRGADPMDIAKKLKTKDKDKIWKEYKKTAGEVESRNTQKRQFMTPKERLKTPPSATQDVPFDEQIVRRWNDSAGGPIVGKALMITSKKAASRRGRPD
jgi:hypothetical protein